MEKINKILKQGFDFGSDYFIDYLKAMIKPIIVYIIGAILFAFAFTKSILILIAFLSIPCFCYGFWRSCVICYAANFAVYHYIKQEKITYEDAVKRADKKQVPYALWLGYCAIISLLPLLLIIPGILLVNKGSMGAILILVLSLAVFLLYFLGLSFFNFSTQAFFYKKKDEKFFDLIKNCYTKTGLQGFIFSFCMGFVLSIASSIGGCIATFLLTPFVIGINNIYYYEKLNEKNS